jgi:hypothetical protein
VGGAIKGLSDYMAQRKGEHVEESELGPGNLFSTGLVAGGALAGVVVAILSVNEGLNAFISKLSVEHALVGAVGESGFHLIGVTAFAIMGFVLYRISRRPAQA